MKESEKKKQKKNPFDKKIDALRQDKRTFIIQSIKFYDFYKEHIYRKHLVVYILSLMLFFFVLIGALQDTNTKNLIIETLTNSSMTRSQILKSILLEKIPVTVLLVFAGVTPYFYISFVGILYSFSLATQILLQFVGQTSGINILFLSIGSMIQLFGTSLAVAIGTYYCKLSTKRFRYIQKLSFTVNDVKKEYYEIKKDEEKLKEIEEKEKERNEKIKQLDVKIPYRILIYGCILSCMIMIIGTLISLI